MKEKKIFIGIDVSKLTLDVFIHGMSDYFKVENSSQGFVKLLERTIQSTNFSKQDLFFCFEDTGKYSKLLSVFFHTEGLTFAMVPALQIKKSLGITRGKNDKVDAQRIAVYAYEKRESIKPTILPGEQIDKLKSLLSLREKLLKHRTAYMNGLTDLHDCYAEGENNLIKEVQLRMIDRLNNEVEVVEKQLIAIIKEDEEMYKSYKLIISVSGIGKVLGWYLIAYTANFRQFSDARAFACYAGIAPFENSSGKTFKPSRVNAIANKQIKTLLSMASMSVIQHRGEFQQYYQKRITEKGKNKMSTLNIIRNKIVFRVFAVIKRETPYVNLYKFVA
ncbi:MAG: IS110 family transposase [Bacteroidales bacterium]|jgi:transposase|nr:IS110 family transposase [Bacteroidales bacterium]